MPSTFGEFGKRTTFAPVKFDLDGVQRGVDVRWYLHTTEDIPIIRMIEQLTGDNETGYERSTKQE